MAITKNISVFIDESGSFDPDRLSSRYYIVCMVFHDQSRDISREHFQVADLICTLELARAKLATPEGLSESERAFFGGERNFKKNFLKLLDRKLFR